MSVCIRRFMTKDLLQKYWELLIRSLFDPTNNLGQQMFSENCSFFTKVNTHLFSTTILFIADRILRSRLILILRSRLIFHVKIHRAWLIAICFVTNNLVIFITPKLPSVISLYISTIKFSRRSEGQILESFPKRSSRKFWRQHLKVFNSGLSNKLSFSVLHCNAKSEKHVIIKSTLFNFSYLILHL